MRHLIAYRGITYLCLPGDFSCHHSGFRHLGLVVHVFEMLHIYNGARIPSSERLKILLASIIVSSRHSCS